MPIEEISIEDAEADWGAFDAILDARSPSEFAEDHLPGAENLPVLDDAERARVGTIYVQESRLRARKIGAALVSRNMARHLETSLAEKPADFAPLVHCWRGGQRSRAMAIILDQIGWRVRSLKGGYKAYRRGVVRRLYNEDAELRAVLIDGPTGVGKTALLAELKAQGAAVIDLEALARHRGSVFGGEPGTPQPSQKMFESELDARMREAIAAAASGAPLFLEAESSKIGKLILPPTLWKAMLAAPSITLEAPLEARARHILSEYPELIEDPARLDRRLERLLPLLGREKIAEWRALAAAGAHHALAEALMAGHYDPAYARSGLRGRKRLGAIWLQEISQSRLAQAAAEATKLAERR